MIHQVEFDWAREALVDHHRHPDVQGEDNMVRRVQVATNIRMGELVTGVWKPKTVDDSKTTLQLLFTADHIAAADNILLGWRLGPFASAAMSDGADLLILNPDKTVHGYVFAATITSRVLRDAQRVWQAQRHIDHLYVAGWKVTDFVVQYHGKAGVPRGTVRWFDRAVMIKCSREEIKFAPKGSQARTKRSHGQRGNLRPRRRG